MVSSLWTVASCIGSSIGGLAYDNVGFEYGTLIMNIAAAFSVIVLLLEGTTQNLRLSGTKQDVDEQAQSVCNKCA